MSNGDESSSGASGSSSLLFGRFEPLEELGAGGFGRVLLCLDVETQSQVAVKVLHRFGGDALLRFKSEFRLLRDVVHPNLVRLGELFEGEGRWAFSLEYVPGTDFLSWVRPVGGRQPFDERRLRGALVQLAHGLVALHTYGLLHRDVKPANVRVTPEGRVVLLDFGVVAQLGASRDPDDWGQGTVAYMAPEQARPGPVGPEADFYALGALLFESLTGQLPFEGTAHEVLIRKQRELPASPSRLEPRVPRDLEELCLGLMLADPHQRRGASDVLQTLGASTSLPPAAEAPSREIFVGRAAELARLHAAFAHGRVHGPELVLIEGESGIGKSALMAQLGAELESSELRVLVLAGRCHPAEQVPYKAFDGCVDRLLRFLKSLDDADVRSWLPDQAELLPLLFPALLGVPALAPSGRARSGAAPPDRSVLFQAFTALLGRVAERRPLALHVDDLQWSDVESLRLLEHLLESSVPLLLVATTRPLGAQVSEVERGLARLHTLPGVTRLALGPLPSNEALTLGAALLERSEDDTLVRRLGQESSGHPLFLAELARDSAAGEHGQTAERGLDQVILQRVGRLPPVARLVLDALAVESGPTPRRVLAQVTGASGDELSDALAKLRAGRLLGLVQRTDFICYHDRVRESVLGALGTEVRVALHRRLAEAWQELGTNEPFRLAYHWLAAAESDRALPWLERAAVEADGKAAYEHAADLYRSMLEQPAVRADASELSRLERALGDALSAAGRFDDAAQAYERALAGASDTARAGLLVRMAEHLLRAGRVEEGLVVAERACAATQLAWPRSPGAALLRLGWHRVCLGLTSFERDSTADDPSTPRQAMQLDALWRLGQSLVWSDLLRGVEMIARHLRLSLASGSPRNIALGLGMEAISMAMQDPHAEGLAARRKAAARWAERVEAPEVRAFAHYAEGAVSIFVGQVGLERFLRAEALCMQQCPGEAWLITSSRSSAMGQLWHLARYPELVEQTTRWLDEAARRGDRAALAELVMNGAGFARHLLADRPDLAIAQIDEVMRPWRVETFGMFHLLELVSRSFVHLYEGGEAPAAYWAETWPRVRTTLIVRSGLPAETVRIFRTAAALHQAFARGATPDEQPLRAARELWRGLRGARTVQSRGITALLGAQLAFVEGNAAEARGQTERALALRMADDAFPGAAGDLVTAALDGAEAYGTRERAVLARLAALGCVAPERMLRAWFPILPALRARAQ
jgi:tetratricopeptide (TPR) repeat protein